MVKKRLMKRFGDMNPDQYNGATLLGLKVLSSKLTVQRMKALLKRLFRVQAVENVPEE